MRVNINYGAAMNIGMLCQLKGLGAATASATFETLNPDIKK